MIELVFNFFEQCLGGGFGLPLNGLDEGLVMAFDGLCREAVLVALDQFFEGGLGFGDHEGIKTCIDEGGV